MRFPFNEVASDTKSGMLSFIGKLSLEEELELADSGKRNSTFSLGEEMDLSEETILSSS